MKAENITRFFVYILTALGAVYAYEILNSPYFIILFFLFILNSRVRILYLSKNTNLLLLSLLGDLVLVFILYLLYPFMSYLLLYITILDSLSFLRGEGYIISGICSAFMLFLLKDRGMDMIIFNVFMIISLSSFFLSKKKINENLKKVEELFDENRRYSYELENTKRILEDYNSKIESLSMLQERNRISREIHDNLGHKLTGTLMQLEAGIKVSSRDINKGMEILSSVKDNLSSSIDLLSHTIQNINPGEYSNRVLSIKQMIEDFISSSNIDIDFQVKGTPIKLYPSAEVALYKNAKEAITNSARHGKAQKIWVTLDYDEHEVTLTVLDKGSGCTSFSKGMGIKGMEERVRILDGELLISIEDGFKVTTMIPIKN